MMEKTILLVEDIPEIFARNLFLSLLIMATKAKF